MNPYNTNNQKDLPNFQNFPNPNMMNFDMQKLQNQQKFMTNVMNSQEENHSMDPSNFMFSQMANKMGMMPNMNNIKMNSNISNNMNINSANNNQMQNIDMFMNNVIHSITGNSMPNIPSANIQAIQKILDAQNEPGNPGLQNSLPLNTNTNNPDLNSINNITNSFGNIVEAINTYNNRHINYNNNVVATVNNLTGVLNKSFSEQEKQNSGVDKTGEKDNKKDEMSHNDPSKNPVINYMTKVVEELKIQMQNIQYYSLLQKLFISYIFKHLEGHIDTANKNAQTNNFYNFYKSHQKFPQNPNEQFPFFGPGGAEIDYMPTSSIEKDPINFMKQMQNQNFNFSNFMSGPNNNNIHNNPNLNNNFNSMNNTNNNNNFNSIGNQNFQMNSGPMCDNTGSKFQAGMSNLDPNTLMQMQGQFSNPMNNPMELLKNLHSSINCQINQNNQGIGGNSMNTHGSKGNMPTNNASQQGKTSQINMGFPSISGSHGNNMVMFSGSTPADQIVKNNVQNMNNNSSINQNNQGNVNTSNTSHNINLNNININNNTNNNPQKSSIQNVLNPSSSSPIFINNSQSLPNTNNQNRVIFNNQNNLDDQNQQIKNLANPNQYSNIVQAPVNSNFTGNNASNSNANMMNINGNNIFSNQLNINANSNNNPNIYSNQQQTNNIPSVNAIGNSNQNINGNQQQVNFNNQNILGNNFKGGNSNINGSQQQFHNMFQMLQNQQLHQHADLQNLISNPASYPIKQENQNSNNSVQPLENQNLQVIHPKQETEGSYAGNLSNVINQSEKEKSIYTNSNVNNKNTSEVRNPPYHADSNSTYENLNQNILNLQQQQQTNLNNIINSHNNLNENLQINMQNKNIPVNTINNNYNTINKAIPMLHMMMNNPNLSNQPNQNLNNFTIKTDNNKSDEIQNEEKIEK